MVWTPLPGEKRVLTRRFKEAFDLAFDLHKDQQRKGKPEPYVGHLIAVASIVIEAGGDEDMAIAALLHDAVEDQGGRPVLEEIRRRFGDRVAGIVEGCTDTDRVEKPTWRLRKEKYIEHIRTEADMETRLVSAADKLHNARSILADYRLQGEDVWRRFKGGREGSLWYYREITNALKERGANPVVEELERVVKALERKAGVRP